ncbi:hypothetical protein TNCV_4819721 [Trichonephila clavipes]|nr:hypothetical protein TNCV_4819721 [Trichonephila clavipes]
MKRFMHWHKDIWMMKYVRRQLEDWRQADPSGGSKMAQYVTKCGFKITEPVPRDQGRKYPEDPLQGTQESP